MPEFARPGEFYHVLTGSKIAFMVMKGRVYTSMKARKLPLASFSPLDSRTILQAPKLVKLLKKVTLFEEATIGGVVVLVVIMAFLRRIMWTSLGKLWPKEGRHHAMRTSFSPNYVGDEQYPSQKCSPKHNIVTAHQLQEYCAILELNLYHISGEGIASFTQGFLGMIN